MATFGQTGNNASSSASSADSEIANKAADAESTPASNGTLDAVVARLFLSDVGSTVARGIIWDVDGNLLATGDEVTISNTTEQEITLPFSGASRISLVAGTKYSYGVMWDDPGTININWSRQGTASASIKNNITYPTPTNPQGVGTVSGPIDMYVSYTEDAGAATQATAYMTTNTGFWG